MITKLNKRLGASMASRLIRTKAHTNYYYPKTDYGPTYTEWKRYKKIIKNARQDNDKIYQKRQDEIDVQWLSKRSGV